MGASLAAIENCGMVHKIPSFEGNLFTYQPIFSFCPKFPPKIKLPDINKYEAVSTESTNLKKFIFVLKRTAQT